MDEQFQDLFKIKPNRKNIAVGDILIAEPFLEGRYFSRSVVYVVEHDGKGSIGFVLNKPMSYTTSDLVGELKGLEFPVYLGGPVEQNQLYYLHTHPELPDALHIADGIYLGGDFGELTRFLKEGQISPQEIRFFAGYSGWESGQLKKELEENSWMVGSMGRDRLFQLPWAELWEKSMSDLGGRYKIWANFPEDPIMN